MKYLIILTSSIFLISCSSRNEQSAWTKAYEEKWSKQLNQDMKSLVPDENNRKKFVQYTIKRLKVELPKGIESVSRDSLLELSRSIGKDYAIARAGKPEILASHVMPWTKQFEKTLRETVASDFYNRGEKLSQTTCDCLIGGLKNIYPDSVTVPFPKEVIYKVSRDCYKEDVKRKANSNLKDRKNRII